MSEPARGLSHVLPHVLAIVVLYRQEPSQSKTLSGLAAAFADDPALAARIDVLVWDNSPDADAGRRAEAVAALPLSCHYQAAARNEGVSGAYNAAAEIASTGPHSWLLLLDQDTSLTGACLRAMLAELDRVDADQTIAAVVPFLYAGSFQLSPRLWRFGRHVPLPRPAQACAERREIFAANSGTLLRVAALKAVGGYSRRFWLDYSDIELFHRLHRHGFAVWIAPNATLQHEVALMDYDGRMSPARYTTYLAAESDFLDLYRGLAERLLHLARLAVRILRQRRLRNSAFSRMSAHELWRRIVTRRRSRLAERDAP